MQTTFDFFFDFLQTTFDYYLQSPIRGYNHTTLRKIRIVTILLFSPNKIPWCVSHDFCCKRFNHISFSSYFVNWASTKDFLFYCIERRNHRNAVPVGKWWRHFYFFKSMCLVESPYMAAKNIYSMSHMKMEWLRKTLDVWNFNYQSFLEKHSITSKY